MVTGTRVGTDGAAHDVGFHHDLTDREVEHVLAGGLINVMRSRLRST